MKMDNDQIIDLGERLRDAIEDFVGRELDCMPEAGSDVRGMRQAVQAAEEAFVKSLQNSMEKTPDEKTVEEYLRDAPANARNNVDEAYSYVLAQTGSYKAAHAAADALGRVLRSKNSQ
jgi:hypothetical protein